MSLKEKNRASGPWSRLFAHRKSFGYQAYVEQEREGSQRKPTALEGKELAMQGGGTCV